MEQVFEEDQAREAKEVKTVAGVIEVKPGDIVLVTANGATWSKLSGSNELTEEDLKTFTPAWILYRDGLAIQYGYIYMPLEMGEVEVFAQKIGYSERARVLLALESFNGAVVDKGEVIIKNKLGWIANSDKLIPDPVKAGNIYVSRRYLDEYDHMKYRLSVSADATYREALELIYYHPLLQYHLASKYGYVPPEPEPMYRYNAILAERGVTDSNTLRPYVNPIVFDFLALIEAVEDRSVEGTVYELVKTTIHELLHSARDSAGHANNRGTWFLGTPMGEEAAVERETGKLAEIIAKDLEQPLSAFIRRVQERMVGANVEVALDLSILLDRLRRLGRNAWINERDVRVSSIDEDEISLTIGIVTGSPTPKVDDGLFEGLRSVKYIESGDDRLYVELVFRTPSIFEYETLEEGED